ncbi:MAG: VacJ family lipoprotein [Gammaproteobacteria bacterium]|nr:VacJ family lipoprotein [Gammaproteobacteria bacterium]
MPGKLAILFVIALLVTGCAGTPNGKTAPAHDPWESYNRAVFNFNENFYEYILDPVSRGYQSITPDFVQTGISNFFSHVDDIFVIVNDLLQLKIQHFAEDFMRFVFNTFFGVFGLIDVAKHMDLPKRNEDFGQTLAYWFNWEDSRYFMLPFLGPSTLRDTWGTAKEWYVYPTNQIDHIRSRNSVIAMRAVDKRSGLLKANRIAEQASFDKYAFIRDAYLQARKRDIHDGNPPREKVYIAPPTKEDEALEKELELLQ